MYSGLTGDELFISRGDPQESELGPKYYLLCIQILFSSSVRILVKVLPMIDHTSQTHQFVFQERIKDILKGVKSLIIVCELRKISPNY